MVYYPYVVHMVGEDAERHLGLLSQIQPLAVHKHVDLSFKYFDKRLPVRRGMLELVFGDPVNDVHYKLFVVHLKSRLRKIKPIQILNFAVFARQRRVETELSNERSMPMSRIS